VSTDTPSDPPSARGRAKGRLRVRAVVNGEPVDREVEPRLLLSDFLRHELGLTGTHVGCEHGVCGACTVLLGGRAVRSCLLFAVQCEGCEVRTVEGLAPGPADADPPLHPLQAAFRDAHGLQCGFCTPGMLMALVPFLAENPDPGEQEVRELLSGHLCRCTGYQFVVDAALEAARRMREESLEGAGAGTTPRTSRGTSDGAGGA